MYSMLYNLYAVKSRHTIHFHPYHVYVPLVLLFTEKLFVQSLYGRWDIDNLASVGPYLDWI